MGGTYQIRHELEISSEKGKLVAVYESFQNGDSLGKTILTVGIEENTALFFYDHCLPGEFDEGPCKNYVDKKGDLMFKLVRGRTNGSRRGLLTYRVKNTLLPNGKVHFKPVRNFE